MSDDTASRIFAAIEALREEVATRTDVAQLRTDLRVDVVALQTELASVRADVMGRIDRLQGRLAAEPEGGAASVGAAERAERLAQEVRDEMRREVATLVEQVGALLRQNQALAARLDRLEGRQQA